MFRKIRSRITSSIQFACQNAPLLDEDGQEQVWSFVLSILSESRVMLALALVLSALYNGAYVGDCV